MALLYRSCFYRSGLPFHLTLPLWNVSASQVGLRSKIVTRALERLGGYILDVGGAPDLVIRLDALRAGRFVGAA